MTTEDEEREARRRAVAEELRRPDLLSLVCLSLLCEGAPPECRELAGKRRREELKRACAECNTRPKEEGR